MIEEKDSSQPHKFKRWLTIAKYLMWTAALMTVVGGFLVFYTIGKGDMPTFEQLENPQYDLASIIYDAKNRSFGKYYIENREPIKFDELSPNVLSALLATEDERFYNHSGIDFWALVRVGVKSVLLQKGSSGGGSTLSQQLAKLLFERPNLRGKNALGRALKLVEVKFKEWITAVKLEKQYTKEEIIAMYLNKFEFINGAHGIQAASETYFDKRQSELEIHEAATLVGMLKNPSLYNPKRFPEKSKGRRNVVLSQMHKAGVIDGAQRDSLSEKTIDMDKFTRKSQSEGPAPYFRSELTKWLRKIFKEKDINKTDGTPYNIYTDGLKIYTTIDLDYQRLAEEAVSEHMKWNQDRYWKAWKYGNPWTFEADEFQKKIRAEIFERRVKSSDRYMILRNKYLESITSTIREEHKGLPLSDNNIKALIRIEQKQSKYEEEVTERNLKTSHQSTYRKLMDDPTWDELKSKWKDLVIAYDIEFNAEVDMMVFDYEEGEVAKTMTPRDSVKFHNQHLQAGMLAVDPHTGYIKAWVGGIGHQYFKYDHVNSRRSVGSTIKPFVYTTAISLGGISPCQTFDDIQYTIAPGDANFDLIAQWSPANANGEFTGNKYNLYQGLLYSKNSISVRLIKELGNVQVVRELLDNVGISKDLTLSNGRLAVPNLPSVCLGAVDLTLYEMTGAYTAFANNGVYTEPIFITRIEDKNGKIIYSGIPKRQPAINPLYNAVIVDMLRNNVGGRYGLGVKSKVGGKTGTTNDYADGWFMGITPNLVVGTWTGGDDKWIRFTTLDDGQGYVMARPICQKFLKKLEKDSLANFNTDVSFPDPPPGFHDLVNCDKYKQILPEDEQAARAESQLQRDEFDEAFEGFDDDLEDDDLELDEEELDDLDEDIIDEDFDDDGLEDD